MELILNVSSKSSTKVLAEHILEILQDQQKISLKAIGAGAVNQAVKAIAIVESSYNIPLATNFSFFNVTIEDEEKSGIRFNIKEVKENG